MGVTEPDGAVTRNLAVGLQLPTTDGFRVGYQDLRRIAAMAEDTGFDSVWVGDHFSFPAPVIESFVAATTAAAATKRVGVGFGVLLAAMRHPGWLAKQISSLQVVSDDRVILGVGVGGEFPDEWEALGVPIKRRGALTDEILDCLPGLLSGQPTQLGPPWDALVPPLTPFGRVPDLWVGGRKDVALRRAVRTGGGWLGVWLDAPALAERTVRLHEIAAEMGRPTPPVATEVLVHPTSAADGGQQEMKEFMEGVYGVPYERVQRYCLGGDEDALVQGVQTLVDEGVQTVILIPAVRDVVSALPSLSRVAERLRRPRP